MVREFIHMNEKPLWDMVNRKLFALPGEGIMIQKGGKFGEDE
jgi:hypothetical protein